MQLRNPATNNEESQLLQFQNKTKYQQTQIINLEQENEEFRNLITLNKEIIRNLQIEIQNIDSKKPSSQKDNQSSNALNNVLEENRRIYKQLEMVTQQRNQAESQVFILEQMLEAAQTREKEAIVDLQEKIQLLKIKLQDKENYYLSQQQDTEKSCAVYPDQETLNLQEQNNKLLQQLMKSQKECSMLKEEKNELLVINSVFGSQLNNLKDKTKLCQCNIQYENEDSSNNEEQRMQIIQAQKKAIQFKDSNSSSSADMEDSLPVKIQTQQFNNKTLNSPGIQTNGNLGLKLSTQEQDPNQKAIPKLDLTKAKKIQQINVKRMQNNEQQQQQQPNDDYNQTDYNVLQMLHQERIRLGERVKQLELENDEQKKKLEDHFVQIRIYQKELENSKQYIDDFIVTNDTLIKGYQNYEQKWIKIWKKFLGYEQYWLRMKTYYRPGKVDEALIELQKPLNFHEYQENQEVNPVEEEGPVSARIEKNTKDDSQNLSGFL